MAVRTESVNFTGALGDTLAARIDRPSGPIRGYALFAHCFTCSKDLAAARHIATGLAERGLAVLRFDFTGLGHSEGEFANTTFASNVEDLVAAADYMRRELRAPTILVGHSLGGAAVLAAAARIGEVRGVATIGAPSDAGHVLHNFKGSLDAIERDGEAEVELAGRRFRIRRSFVEDLRDHRLTDLVSTLRKDLLIFHAPLDETVGISNATDLFVAAKHPKSFVSLDKADHLLTRRADSAYVAAVLSGWAERFLPAATPDTLQAREGEVVVADAGDGLFPQWIAAGPHHRIRADEPTSVGGTDSGPSPYDLLLAGLGACTNMTLKMYADRKGWSFDRLETHLRHSKIHAEDCADCESQDRKIDRIERVLVIDGELDADQRGKLLEIADKCPVHRTLHSEISIVTTLDPQGTSE
ncbi:bifunctional alpha/beta hydrolase/OsmC family protein [Thalassobaculum sp. OXR-137]|uniref:bifunctional alpha/beta hydrolase/OsmC family protein n=1 Tax=Thalassobaculum sp. OXR-137 TaxID=3100173 RepID=UPI002AC93154|nr:bifunctional alpha/beta hydrolase/OsmC family protein [Thalassobaculum sp. OXR-137]WPZ33082.1 bifunctional alpha/beta hydrolase/OsmC family protein [Thalassobaculum sp. OXR-137]